MSKQKLKGQVDFAARSSESLQRRPLRTEKIENEIEEDYEEESTSTDDSEGSHSSRPDKVKIERKKISISKKKHNKGRQVPKRNKVDTLSVGRSPGFKHYRNYLIASIVVVSVLCIIWITLNFEFFSKKKVEAEVTLSQVLKDMKNRFKPQSDLTYRNLKAQLKKVFNVAHEPQAPAIITAIADRGAESTASDIGLYLGSKLAPERYILINGTTYWNDNPDTIKLRIDEEVQTKYQREQFNVIIIDKLHKIPFEAAMMFHSYCDHENSEFKRALFLFILPLNEIISEATMKGIDSVAMHSLRNVWSNAVDDKVDSLVTRISGAVINIK